MKTTVDVLREARVLIERGWCQWRAAIDEDGNGVAPWSNRARCWCALGALAAVDGEPDRLYAMTRPALIHALPDGHSVSAFNDAPGRTQADILALYDRAIALAGQEASNG